MRDRGVSVVVCASIEQLLDLFVESEIQGHEIVLEPTTSSSTCRINRIWCASASVEIRVRAIVDAAGLSAR